jgi:glycosyltransferase involved in cell wall biosynthesis
MKVVLVALSGDAGLIAEKIAAYYPQAIVESISRTEFETGSYPSRLGALRASRADVFALATERLAWQRGQHLLMLFGALAGVRQVAMLDVHGGLRVESRARVLFRAPARLVRETALSAMTLLAAWRQLRQLERAIKKGAAHFSHEPAANPAGGPQDRLRVIYMRSTPGPGTQFGGASSHMRGVLDALSELGTQTRVISNDAIAGLAESKVPLTIIGPEPMGATRAVFDIHNNMVFTRGAVPQIERYPPDFIYQRYARFSWAGVVASLRTKRPLFLEYNGSEVWVGRHWDHVGMLTFLARFESLNLAAATRIFVVSEVERNNLERAGIASHKIIVNPNAVDTEMFRPGVGGDRVRRDFSIRDAEILVGFVGTFGSWHGVLALAEAIRLTLPKASVGFLLVGGGILHGKMSAMLKGEEKRVIFLGPVAHEKVPALLDACDILVSPHVPLENGAAFFGSPTKLFEYMAMGKAIVASRLGQIGDVLTDEETALLVEPGNAAQLSGAIMRLAESRALRERLGAAARRAAIERHTWKRNAQTVLDAYRAWLAESRHN